MPKDNENVPIFTDEPIVQLEPQAFALDQLVRCEECLRANPPTRVDCLYCKAVLPTNETTINLQKPALRPLETWEQGYNNILWPPPANLCEPSLSQAATLLRLTALELTGIVDFGMSLPVARAATRDEALLVQRRLATLGVETRVVPDTELGLDETGSARVRAIEIDNTEMRAFQTPDTPAVHIPWSDFELLVAGRLITRRVEVRERKRRTENSIVDSSEFFADEIVFEVHTRSLPTSYRFSANSFDFSSLGTAKSVLAFENLASLMKLFCEYAPHAELDDSYNLVRKALEKVWPSEQQNVSSGWRRERPGKYIVGSATATSNEKQFMRYSRLRYFLLARARETEE